MGIFCEIRNEALICELQRELNTDVLLFGFDGFTYFGNLQAIEDCRIAILTRAKEACRTDVEILTPGGEIVEVSFLRVDLWQIVAKGTGVVTDPIDNECTGRSGGSGRSGKSGGSGGGGGGGGGGSNKSSSSKKSGSRLNLGAAAVPTPPVLSATTDEAGRQESHHLIRQLKRMTGDCVVVTTLGGFLFEGVLGQVCDELAILAVEDVFLPGTSRGISDRALGTVVVNLEALTSVASATKCKSSESDESSSSSTGRSGKSNKSGSGKS